MRSKLGGADCAARSAGVLALVPHRAIATKTSFEHAREDGQAAVHVVVDPDLLLLRQMPMKTPGVLDERALPGNGEGEEEGVQARVVEPLACVAARRENDALFIGR